MSPDDQKAAPREEWLHRDRFPRTAKYDLDWILANEMGPNALWLLEDLCDRLDLKPGMRVLDLGCGRAMTSVFLAREFGLRVWANDLWIDASDNWKRVREAGLGDSICPIRAEAHALPYATEFFDAVVSVDSYQYFGTSDLYLGYVTRFLRPGGLFGLIIPSILQEIEEEPPAHLTRKRASGAVFWDPKECWCLHGPDWWRRHLVRPGLLAVDAVDTVEDGWVLWRDWERIRDGGGFTGFPSDAEVLEEDQGRWVGFTRVVARKPEDSGAPGHHSLTMRV